MGNNQKSSSPGTENVLQRLFALIHPITRATDLLGAKLFAQNKINQVVEAVCVYYDIIIQSSLINLQFSKYCLSFTLLLHLPFM